MALKRYTIDGYGQIELNQVAFRRDGRIEAQCKLDTATDFGDGKTLNYAENGMLLAVDNISRTIKLPADGTYPIALNYTTEHMYDERKPGLKNFKLVSAAAGEDFLPRVGYLAAGDLFTTNCIDLGSYASAEAVATALASGEVYAAAGTQGAIVLGAAPSVGPVMQVIKKTTMPDGQDAFQIQVLKV